MRRPPPYNVAKSKDCQYCGETFAPGSNRTQCCSVECLLRLSASPEPNTGCWIWVRSKGPHGYGTTQRGTIRQLAHRLSYECFKGEVPAGLFVCHRCDVKLCINPDHLFLGTGSDNMQDCARKGRNSRKLTDEEVVQIRCVVGVSRMHLGRLYGVSDTMIRVIQRGEWWRHLLDEKNPVDNDSQITS